MPNSQIMKYFLYEDMPKRQRDVIEPICKLARQYDYVLPDSAEKSAGLRKLLEAKDCMLRAATGEGGV